MMQKLLGLGPSIVGVARRQPIDVVKALEAARHIEADEDLAEELVRIAIDADGATPLQ